MVKATIANGKSEGEDFTKEFTITVTMPEKEVTVQAKWIYVPGTGGGDVKPPIVVDPVEPSEPDVSFVDVKVGDWYEEAVEYERTIGRHALPLRGQLRPGRQPGGVSGWSSCFRLGGGRHGLGNRLGDHQRHGRLLKAPVRRHPRPAGRHADALHRLILYASVGAAL